MYIANGSFLAAFIFILLRGAPDLRLCSVVRFPRFVSVYRFSRSDQALLIKPDQILPAAFDQRFSDKVIIIGIAVLNQCPLHRFFMRIAADIHFLTIPGINSRIVHDCGHGRRCRVEILHLFRHISQIPQILR